MHDLPLLTTLAAAFASAWVLGLITQRLGLSPIVGYLLGGVAIGPFTPGFVGDVHLAQQLAEVGVILLMFGVGLHFHLKDLLAVKSIAVPGAIVQSLTATLLSVAAFLLFGWSWKSGLVMGMALSVASTVVLLRVLMDRGMLSTSHGHVAVGWLIVEDIFTVLALVLVPIIAVSAEGAAVASGAVTIAWAIAKLAIVVLIVLVAGSRVVPWTLSQVAKLRSRELFTLTVLVLSVTIAVGASALFDVSVALGAFLAGMVVAQSPVSHQAATDALPMRDAFAVLFFVTVGMLFDPAFLVKEPLLMACGLAIVLLAKPLAALAVVVALGYPARTALTVAIGLAQIGEFSFILSEVAHDHGLMPDEGRHVLIGTAMLSITLNPLLFRNLDRIEAAVKARPRLWRLLNARAERRANALNSAAQPGIASAEKPLAIIVGYGPTGRVVDALLRDAGMHTVIIEMNMETVESIIRAGRSAIFGDATHPEILEQAGIRRAVHLILTLPNVESRVPVIHAARELNPAVEITVRARYLQERQPLTAAGAAKVIYEEGEAGAALARHVMERRGVDPQTIEKLVDALRKVWGMNV